MWLFLNPQQLKQRANFPKWVRDISLTPVVPSIPQQTAPNRNSTDNWVSFTSGLPAECLGSGWMSFRQSIILLKRFRKISPIILHLGTVETPRTLGDSVTVPPQVIPFEMLDCKIWNHLWIKGLELCATAAFFLKWCHFPILRLNCYDDRTTPLSYRLDWWGSEGDRTQSQNRATHNTTTLTS